MASSLASSTLLAKPRSSTKGGGQHLRHNTQSWRPINIGTRKRGPDMTDNQRRALKIWQVLISQARNRQTTTYQALAREIEERGIGQRNLGPHLDRVSEYTAKVRNVDLTAIVVRAHEGRPGRSTGSGGWDVEREKAYGINWYGVTPPAPQDFRE